MTGSVPSPSPPYQPQKIIIRKLAKPREGPGERTDLGALVMKRLGIDDYGTTLLASDLYKSEYAVKWLFLA